MPTHTAPLVGSHFHAPAKGILACLPNRTPVVVIPEPTNPFDENALRVHVSAGKVPESQHEKLGMLLGGYGYQLDEFLAPVPASEDPADATTLVHREWMLGHIKRDHAATLAPMLGGHPHPGTLVFDADGKPHVEINLP